MNAIQPNNVKPYPTRAMELFNLGYEPIPIAPAKKSPITPEWPTADVKEIVSHWPSDNHGVGLRLGTNGFGAIDIDILDGPMADEILSILRKSIGDIQIRIGLHPKALVPVQSPDIGGKIKSRLYQDQGGITHQIEFLSTGQMFVAYGIHPNTLEPYKWSGELPHCTQLPLFTREKLDQLFDQFDRLALDRGWELIEKHEGTGIKPVTSAVEHHFNELFDIEKVLLHYGWIKGKKNHWIRPDKTDGDISGSVKNGVLHCFTSSTCLAENGNYRSFDIVMAYSFNGDRDEMLAYAQNAILDEAAKVFSKPYTLPPDASLTPAQPKANASLNTLLEKYEVRKDYVDGLGEEEFYYDNLIIKNHILIIIAESGGGKTTFLYFHVAAKLAKKGIKVLYIDADSPASDHKKMKAFADQHGIIFMIPDVNEGTSTASLLEEITELANSQTDLSNYVLIFDTLKKFIDLMSKQSAKEFFILMRRLTKLGATIVLPGHANKNRDSDGNLVFEGVGDVRSDADDMIFFEKNKKMNGSIDVTTVVDTNKGAKVRGIFEPISFNIDVDRQITFYDKPLDLANLTNTGVRKATDEDILTSAAEYLKNCGEPVLQNKLVQHTRDRIEGKAGVQKIREVIVKRAVKKGDQLLPGTRFVYTIGERNSHYYELPSFG